MFDTALRRHTGCRLWFIAVRDASCDGTLAAMRSARSCSCAHATTSRLLLSSLVQDPVLSMRLTHLWQQPAPILHFSVPVRTTA